MSESQQQMNLEQFIRSQRKEKRVPYCLLCNKPMKKHESNWTLGEYFDTPNNTWYSFRLCSEHGHVEVDSFQEKYPTTKDLFNLYLQQEDSEK